MIDIKNFVHMFLNALNDAFGSRIWFVGLQGSYGRGEETESSDIDMVVILDSLSVSDISTYNDMLNNLPHRELVCGFISGKEEIMNWEPSDLFQFCNDTTPIKGSLDKVLALIDQNAVNRVIKIGACNIYHGCVHNMLQAQRGLSCLKKSLPLLSTRINAGKSTTSIFQIASMPSSGYSTHSMLLMLF